MVNRIQNQKFTKTAIGQLQTKDGRVTILLTSKWTQGKCNYF